MQTSRTPSIPFDIFLLPQLPRHGLDSENPTRFCDRLMSADAKSFRVVRLGLLLCRTRFAQTPLRPRLIGGSFSYSF
jgi:hypothetical protein